MTEERTTTELILPGPAEALSALLDLDHVDLGDGRPLPFAWHWVYLLDRHRQSDLGEDGHPVRDAFPTSPGPGLRRLWAGGRIRSHGALRIGEVATRRSAVGSTMHKQGRTGPLTFVTVSHEIEQRGRVVIEERQDLVYRMPASPDSRFRNAVRGGAAQPEATTDGVGWELAIDETFLFRFSALTYNAHRIHYDRDYATGVEGYPDLMIHGPLQALAMAETCRGTTSRARSSQFEYRITAPLHLGQGLVASSEPLGARWATSITDRGGRETAQGQLETW